MKRMVTRFLAICLLLSISGCAELNAIGDNLFTDMNAQMREVQESFDRQKLAFEDRARGGYTTWAEAARNVRNLDRSFVGNGRWKFDSDDEEYHAYSIATAERVDSKQLSFAQYDALRTRRFSEIVARRQLLINSQPRSNSTNCRSIRNADGSVSTVCN